jgi:hypothetical protein
MATQFAKVKEAINAAQQMIRGNVCIELEGVEQLVLCAWLLTHHLGVPLVVGPFL